MSNDEAQIIEHLHKQNEILRSEIEQVRHQLIEIQAQQQQCNQWTLQFLNDRGLKGLRDIGYIFYILLLPMRFLVRSMRWFKNQQLRNRFRENMNRLRDKSWDWLFFGCLTFVITQRKGLFLGISSIKESDLWRKYHPGE